MSERAKAEKGLLMRLSSTWQTRTLVHRGAVDIAQCCLSVRVFCSGYIDPLDCTAGPPMTPPLSLSPVRGARRAIHGCDRAPRGGPEAVRCPTSMMDVG